MNKFAAAPAVFLKLLGALKSTNTAKFLGSALHSMRTGGASELLKNVSRYRTPLQGLTTSQIAGMKARVPIGASGFTPAATVARGVRSFLGNLAYNAQTMGNNVTRSGVFAPVQLAKNFARLGKEQILASQYKVVPATARSGKWFSSGIVSGPNGKAYYKGWSRFLPKREVIGKTTTGDNIIKKRLPIRPVAAAFIGPGFGAMTYLEGSDKPKGKRIADAAGEAALWTIAPQLGIAKNVYQMLR